MSGGALDLPDPGPFRLPAPNLGRHPAVLLKPRELRAWIEELPLANPPRSAQLLLQQMRLIVRDPQPGSKFAALLDLFEAPLGELLEIVQDRLQTFGDSAVPLDQLEYQVVELLNELACGHLRLANQALQAGRSPDPAGLGQALRLLDQALDIERLHYHRLAPEAWRRVLGIFVHAERLGLAGQTLAGAAARGEAQSIRGLFFRSLLISLSDPHHHRPHEVLSWLNWLGGHSAGLRLSLLPEGAYAIPVDISGELPPLAGARRGRPGPETRYLAVDALLDRLQAEASAPPGLRQALLDVIKGRKTPEQRQGERQARNQAYRLVYGLRPIHARLSELIRGQAPTAGRLEPVDCRLVNQSRSGAALHLQGPLNPALCVDEPVLAEAATAGGPGAPVGFAARVRRLVSDDGGQIEIGVEKLAGRLLPVSLAAAAGEGARSDPHALLLQSVDSGSLTLIAPRSRFREGECVTVEGPNTRYSLRLKAIAQAVHNLAYIEVEAVER